jgi:hypothetical protein
MTNRRHPYKFGGKKCSISKRENQIFDSKGTSQDFKRNQELSNIIMYQSWATIGNMNRPLVVIKLVSRFITTIFKKSKT